VLRFIIQQVSVRPAQIFVFHFIGSGNSKDAAENITEKEVYGVGFDGPSADPGQNLNFDAHRRLLRNNILGIENLKLEKGELPGNYTNFLTFRFSHLTPSSISCITCHTYSEFRYVKLRVTVPSHSRF
jgi:kynurenine formamidase